MRASEDRIAKIERTFLGVEDHGIFTAMLHVSYGGSGQAIGGYALDTPVKKDGRFVGRFGTAYGMEFVRSIVAACGVDCWEKVAGRTVIVITEAGWNGKVLGIRPLATLSRAEPTEPGTPFLFADIEGYTGDRYGDVA